jgi:hypothetical protein
MKDDIYKDNIADNMAYNHGDNIIAPPIAQMDSAAEQ